MFIKPFRVKSHSQMKGSDKKKLKAQVTTQFCISDCDKSKLDSLFPPKDEAIITKIYTYNGESVLVYSVEKDPLFFEIDKQKVLYPTVYALWKYPELLGRKFMPTVPGVVTKLTNGADLMLPGVIADVENRGMKAYCDGNLKKGEVLYINLVENKAAIAVGTSFQSSEDLYMQGMRGKAVNILHCIGDQLWLSGNQTDIPQLGEIEYINELTKHHGYDNIKNNTQCVASLLSSESPETKETLRPDEPKNDNTYSEEPSVPSIENAVANLIFSPTKNERFATSAEEDSIELLSNEAAEEKPKCDKDDETYTDPEETIESNQDHGSCEELDPGSTEEKMDELVHNAFLQSLRTTAKKLELPILTSTFYRQHMLPACPSEIGGPIDLKKSSYKKLSKFLSKMMEDQVICIKEQKKGVEVIAQVNYQHEKLLRFRPAKFSIPEKNENKQEVYSPPVITELYLVTAQVSNFFSKCGMRKGDGLTGSEVRECVRGYVCQEKLQHPTDPTMINLDPIIAEVVLVKGENLVVTFRWDKLTSRITSKMSKGFSMDFKNGNKTKSIVQKGKLDPIEMTLGTRSGNKKVTLIHNLDIYGIDMSEFSHKCQIGVAASTAIHEASNKRRAGGHPVMELLIQGNQVAFASKLLIEEYKMPPKYIRGTELAAKKKKASTKK